MTESINDEAVFRGAPATLGLLIIWNCNIESEGIKLGKWRGGKWLNFDEESKFKKKNSGCLETKHTGIFLSPLGYNKLLERGTQ